jgi:hypothetical protein
VGIVPDLGSDVAAARCCAVEEPSGIEPGMNSRRWIARGAVVAALVVVGGGEDASRAAGEPDEAGGTCAPDEPGYIIPANAGAFQVVEDKAGDGAFVMLNLYRLREFADYSAWPDLEPESPITGIEAFEQLAATLDAELAKVGGEVIFRAEGGAAFVGPLCERWDVVQLVRYPSYEAFTQFAATETVFKSIPHRFATLEDSRVVPLMPEGCGRPGRPFPGAPPAHANPAPMGTARGSCRPARTSGRRHARP